MGIAAADRDPDIGGLVDWSFIWATSAAVCWSQTREKAGKLSMAIDNNERSNRGGAGGIIGDFLSIGKELAGKAEIGESPTARAESCP